MASPAPTVSAPVPVSMLRVPTDRFFCAPYKMAMMAKGCVERQAMVRVGDHRLDYSKCAGCGLGMQVEKAVGAAAIESRPGRRSKLAQDVAPPAPARLVEVSAPPPEPIEATEPLPPVQVAIPESPRAMAVVTPISKAALGRKRSVSAQVTEAEAEAVMAAADADGVTVSDWVRKHLLLGLVVREPNSKEPPVVDSSYVARLIQLNGIVDRDVDDEVSWQKLMDILWAPQVIGTVLRLARAALKAEAALTEARKGPS